MPWAAIARHAARAAASRSSGPIRLSSDAPDGVVGVALDPAVGRPAVEPLEARAPASASAGETTEEWPSTRVR